MNRHFLFAMLVMTGICSQALGQSTEYIFERYIDRQMNERTRTAKMFNSSENSIYHTHSVYMQDGSALYFELASTFDYEDIWNLDSLLEDVNNAILFYKDSLDARRHENVRIDYLLDPKNDNTRFRYVLYPPSSDMFISRKGEMSQLKVEQDTIRIRIIRPLPDFPTTSETGSFKPFIWKNYRPRFPIQITFVLNNYTDLTNILADYEFNPMVDTFYKLTKPTRKRDMKETFAWLSYKTIANIRSTPNENIQVAGKKYGTSNMPYHSPIRHVNFYGNIGAGLVQNKIAPLAEAGIEYRWLWTKGEYDYSFLNLNVAPYFLFDRHTDGTYHTYDSWFINFYGGASADNNIFNLKTRREYFGAGYLINPNGIHFKRTTFKIFMGIQFRNSITIVPEVIVTDNMQSIYPGFTLKVF